MNFAKNLEGPELKMPSLHDLPDPQNDSRAIGFQPLATMQPQKQWQFMNAPDGSGDFTPFSTNKAPVPQTLNRRFASNDESKSS